MPHFSIDQFSPRIKGDGDKDDTGAFMDAITKLPPRPRIEWPDDFRIRITDTCELDDLTCLDIGSNQRPHDAFVHDPCAGFVWDGPKGAPMFVLRNCYRPEFRRLAFFAHTRYDATGGADICVQMEQRDGPHPIMHRARFIECSFVSGFRNPNWIGVANALESGSNCEYNELIRCIGYGGAKPGGSLTRVYRGVSMDAGSTTVRAKPGTFTKNDETWKERVRVMGGLMLDAHIVHVINDQQAVLDAPATIAVTDAYALVGESYGTLFKNGPSFNAKAQLLDRCEAYGCEAAVRSLGGSVHIKRLNTNDCEVDIHIGSEAQSESSYEEGSNSEGSRSHLMHLSGESYTMSGATRLAMDKMGSAYIALGAGDPHKQLGSGSIEIAGNHIEGDVPPGARVFDLRSSSRHVESRINTYWRTWTREQMGWLPTQLGNGVTIHSLSDNMSGGPAQTKTEEWIEAAAGQQEWLT